MVSTSAWTPAVRKSPVHECGRNPSATEGVASIVRLGPSHRVFDRPETTNTREVMLIVRRKGPWAGHGHVIRTAGGKTS
jgi:hypothetical protein